MPPPVSSTFGPDPESYQSANLEHTTAPVTRSRASTSITQHGINDSAAQDVETQLNMGLERSNAQQFVNRTFGDGYVFSDNPVDAVQRSIKAYNGSRSGDEVNSETSTLSLANTTPLETSLAQATADFSAPGGNIHQGSVLAPPLGWVSQGAGTNSLAIAMATATAYDSGHASQVKKSTSGTDELQFSNLNPASSLANTNHTSGLRDSRKKASKKNTGGGGSSAGTRSSQHVNALQSGLLSEYGMQQASGANMEASGSSCNNAATPLADGQSLQPSPNKARQEVVAGGSGTKPASGLLGAAHGVVGDRVPTLTQGAAALALTLPLAQSATPNSTNPESTSANPFKNGTVRLVRSASMNIATPDNEVPDTKSPSLGDLPVKTTVKKSLAPPIAKVAGARRPTKRGRNPAAASSSKPTTSKGNESGANMSDKATASSSKTMASEGNESGANMSDKATASSSKPTTSEGNESDANMLDNARAAALEQMGEQKGMVFNPLATKVVPVRIYIGRVDPKYVDPHPTTWSKSQAQLWEAKKQQWEQKGRDVLKTSSRKGTRSGYNYWEWTTRGAAGEKVQQWVLWQENVTRENEFVDRVYLTAYSN
ncbi:uncharacterized protein LY89DRAFT_673415 [Mollisia scopiformis]|uniref:Uncharacterized protein n=1 Tax=Mollisia scopiformis TaxID=149040 RepID=A0A194WWX9_MOLSC|nr:uncharacterized protein LY89DRAFT_673415 [Mollisia scopiformis]KUJ12435.1 hypothetical protein LY89DRAFT_673415 [Mollisia scopiformis]